MSMGGASPPYRKPCVAGAARFFIGPVFQHGSAPVLRDRYVNNTLVPNRDDTANVFPYEIYFLTSHAELSCEAEGSPLGGNVAPVTNTWTPDGTKIDFAVKPRARGWKGVQAGRNWHGRPGYLEPDTWGSFDTVTGCGTGASPEFVAYRSAQRHPLHAKYLGMHMLAEHKITTFDPPPTVVDDHIAEAVISIDRISGRWGVGAASASPNAYGANRALGVIGIALWTMSNFVSRCAPITPGGTHNWSGQSATVTEFIGGADRVVEDLSYDVAGGSLSRTTYHWEDLGAPGPAAWTQFVDFVETILISQSGLSYYTLENDWETGDHGLNKLADTVEVTVSGDMNDANNYTDVIADAYALLGQWDLSDDAQYPWRIDQQLGCAPLVSYDEKGEQGFSMQWYVPDYANPYPTDPGGHTMPDPGWDFDAGIMPQLDPATGSAYGTWTGHVNAGDDMTGTPTDNAGVLRPTNWTVAGGMLPTGVSLDPSTGLLSGVASTSGNYAITIKVDGAQYATGAVKGAPKPAGYQNYFDDAFNDWKGCCHVDEFGSKDWDPYLYGLGQSLFTYNAENGVSLPANSTQWPHRYSMMNNPPGAWMMAYDKTTILASAGGCPYGGTAAKQHALTVCKYAEVLDMWKSTNFARPAGADKFAFDQTAVYGVRDFDGSSFVPQSYIGLSQVDTTIPDTSGIWGGASVGGFYHCHMSGDRVVLDDKVYDLPTGWTMDTRDDDTSFGRLRWPSAPSLLGRAAVTPASGGTAFTFVAAQPNFGLSSSHTEAVDLWDKDMNILGTTTATRTSDGTFTTVAALPNAAFVTINGTTWYMADDKPKGDFVALTWLKDNRSEPEQFRLIGTLDCSGTQVAQPTNNLGGGPLECPFQAFSATGRCVPFVPCAPKVACFSPNGEQFQNGVTIDFPSAASFEMDPRYGSLWQGFILAAMEDPFFQTPHVPFTGVTYPDTAAMAQDNVTCEEDFEEDFGGHTFTHFFYQHAPMVEALAGKPCNYGLLQNECPPDPPEPLGFVDPVLHPDGQQPPPYIGFLDDDMKPNGVETAWALHQRLCAAPTNPTCEQFDYAGAVPGCT